MKWMQYKKKIDAITSA